MSLAIQVGNKIRRSETLPGINVIKIKTSQTLTKKKKKNKRSRITQ
jgi:hypothetical protein